MIARNTMTGTMQFNDVEADDDTNDVMQPDWWETRQGFVAGSDDDKDRLLPSGNPDESGKPRSSELIEQHQNVNVEWADGLEDAWKSRQLMSAVIGKDWLGLQIMAHLRDTGSESLSAMASQMKASADDIAAILATLTLFGGVTVDDSNLFLLSARGASIVDNIERNTGIDLSP
ncbi:MAG: hypothetical protein IID44_28575 [Planctomycetes bacterium]|nr:hypothetical protein [Planctomycetota bacterium]